MTVGRPRKILATPKDVIERSSPGNIAMALLVLVQEGKVDKYTLNLLRSALWK